MKKLLIGLVMVLLMPGLVKAEAAIQNPIRTRVMQMVETMEQTRLTERTEKKEQLRQRLAELQDQRKAKIAERVNTQLNQINQGWTEAMERRLTRISALVDKLVSRMEKMVARGLETAETEAAIAEAEAAIAEATAAVEAQAGKEYVIEFTDESGLRVGASTAKTELRDDLRAVKDLVKAARQAVGEVIQVAKLANQEAE